MNDMFRPAQRLPLQVPLRCKCGRIRGVARGVSRSNGFRFICYCKDCQAFAHFLKRPDVLGPAGGTDIYQMPPARLSFTAGMDAMRCLSFSSTVLRWYADCCGTPISNTAAGPGFPVIGLIHSFMDCAAVNRSLDEALGPPLCRIYERSAAGPLPADAPPPATVWVFARRASLIAGWWLRGLGRQSPFFDDQTRTPHASPRVLARNGQTAA